MARCRLCAALGRSCAQKPRGAMGGGAAGGGPGGGVGGSEGGGGGTQGPAARMRAAAISSKPAAAVCTQTAATRKGAPWLALALALALLGGRKLS